jgi:hypothetical protein
MTEIRLQPAAAQDLVEDPVLEQLARRNGEDPLSPATTRSMRGFESTPPADRPFDMRFNAPIAYDLRRLAQSLGKAPDPQLAAILGPNVPVILHHQVTPFAEMGEVPGGVWGLGYEIEPIDLDARTVSVAPSDERLTIGKVQQEVELGLGLGGALNVPSMPIATSPQGPSFDLPGVKLKASMSQEATLSLRLTITLQKVIGAGFGRGGAKWDLYRQDEPLSVPHVLVQTLVVPEGTRSFRARVRMWAKKAGWLGTRFRGKLWPYPPQEIEISLRGLNG